MSLDTVLQIGKALRCSKNGMRHFTYIKRCPQDTEKESVIRLNIPVKADFSFDWTNVSLVPENQAKTLYYLAFKTSDADSLVKYLFGDLYYERKSSVKADGTIQVTEGGFYRLTDETAHGLHRKSSFERCEDDFERLRQRYEQLNTYDHANPWPLSKFRNSFGKSQTLIETILKNISAVNDFIRNGNSTKLPELLNNEEVMNQHLIKVVANTINKKHLEKVFGKNYDFENTNSDNLRKIKSLSSAKAFLHFDFSGKHWYDFTPDLDLVTSQMLDDFFEKHGHGFVINKTLYKTLCSGDKKNDIQFPGFISSSKYKSKYFSDEDAKDLFYAKEYSEKALLTIKGDQIKLIVLPRGDNLYANDYEEFLEKANENRIIIKNEDVEDHDEEPLFAPLSKNENPKITSFDFIFSKKGGLTSPDSDLIELSGIEKSNLKATMQRINLIANQIKQKYEYEQQPKIEWSFLNILGTSFADVNTGKITLKPSPKYQSHILKVLPQIYSQTYVQDNILIPSFIDKVEFSIRSGDPKYFALKHHFEFLITIQNTPNNKYMQITDSKSYRAGLLLGSLSKGLKKKINSFEKNYVGNLSRRISTLDDCIKLKNEIEQKNILHDLADYTKNISNELSVTLKELQEFEYDKEHAAFGFFESYFRYETKKGFIEKLEKLLTDFSSSEEKDTTLIQIINEVLDNYQNK